MTFPKTDDLDRVRFAWPEPLVIELIGDQYTGLIDGSRRMAVAKLHEQLLRSLVEGRETHCAALRCKLLAHCRASGLDAEVIARIDHAVLFELIRILGMRFRNSPRLHHAYALHLQATLPGIATAGDVEEKRAAPISPASTARPQCGRWRVKAATAG